MLSLLSSALLLSACADTYQNFGRHSMWTPKPLMLTRGIPQGNDSYSIGFRDGCNTMLGVVGSAMLRMHGSDYDVNRGIEDKDYYLGVRMGQAYCTYGQDPGTF